MRTIRVELESQADAKTRLRVSTEVIVDDDENAGDAGREACRAINAFVNGYADEVET